MHRIHIDVADGALNIIVFEVSAYVDETIEPSPVLFRVLQFYGKNIEYQVVEAFNIQVHFFHVHAVNVYT